MKPRLFATIFLTAYAVFAACLLGFAAWLEPFEGDLTRIGGKSENRYGWQQPQAAFDKNLSRYASAYSSYDGVDLIVFGDSFSHMGTSDGRRFGWQNYLSAATGLEIATYHLGLTDFRDWLRAQPADALPDFVVYQIVERGLSETDGPADNCGPALPAHPLSDVQLVDGVGAENQIRRSQGGALEFQTAAHWLKTNMRRKQEVRVFKLSRSDLFSNVESGEILVYEDDFLQDAKRRENLNVAGIGCHLAELQALAEANGRTRLIVAIAPDKSTVYQSFMPDAAGHQNLFQRLEEGGVPVYRLDRIFQDRVAAGVSDLYLPNDTHWGSEGNRLFASVIAELIELLASDRHTKLISTGSE